MNLIKNGSQFIDALAMQSRVREDGDNAKNPHTKKRLKKEYETISAAISEYVKNMNSKGERDEIV